MGHPPVVERDRVQAQLSTRHLVRDELHAAAAPGIEKPQIGRADKGGKAAHSLHGLFDQVELAILAPSPRHKLSRRIGRAIGLFQSLDGLAAVGRGQVQARRGSVGSKELSPRQADRCALGQQSLCERPHCHGRRRRDKVQWEQLAQDSVQRIESTGPLTHVDDGAIHHGSAAKRNAAITGRKQRAWCLGDEDGAQSVQGHVLDTVIRPLDHQKRPLRQLCPWRMPVLARRQP